ncbi:porin [Burkholderia anthina]|uniref:porin n=1 Tax=Burkholderia anthina TaxID=179879 RepID=UPI0015890718
MGVNGLLLCSAIAGVTVGTSCFAQSSVALYGDLDAGFLYTNRTLDSATNTNAGHQFSLIDTGMTPTNIGILGTEDLGGGLQAKFKLENGFSVTNGGLSHSNGNFFGRQAWVALDGVFGEMKLGLQFSPFVLAVLGSDSRNVSHFGASLVPYVDNVLVTGLFNQNAISYTSPSILGLTGSVMFSFGGHAGDFQAGRQYSGSLTYSNGGLMLNAAFYDGNGGASPTPTPSTVPFVGRTLGAAYTFGSLTAKGAFTSYKVAGSFSSNVFSGGVECRVTPALDLNGGVWFTSDRNDAHNHSILGAIGADYSLSKRTGLYAQVGVVNNHGAMNTGLGISGNALFGLPGTTVGINAGIHHVF